MARIIVVDDNPDIVRIAKTALSLAGHEVLSTEDPRKVGRLAAAAGVELAVLDVMMPEYSGYDVLRDLRGDPKTTQVPVVFLTAMSEPVDRVRGLAEGADDYLTKPFTTVELVLRVNRLLRSGQAKPADPARAEADRLRQALSQLEDRRRQGEPPGEVSLGRYQVLELLGDGGMGSVYRGWDPKLQRPVALKTLGGPRGAALPFERSEMVQRLLLEAVMVAQVSHPNVVAVYDVGEAEDAGYIAMEMVEGASLQRLLAARGRLEPALAIPLAAGILRGLAAAHLHRLVHHDVKPANILLGNTGGVKLSDFGVAELLSSWARESGMIYGTPGYLPPETLRGEGYDERGDVFAAGVVLYECLVGRQPFAGPTLQETVRHTLEAPLTRPSALVPSLDPETDSLVSRFLAREPADRFANATEAADLLDAICMGEGWQWSPVAAGLPLGPEAGALSPPTLSALIPAQGAPFDPAAPLATLDGKPRKP